jgi:hypothetical protein
MHKHTRTNSACNRSLRNLHFSPIQSVLCLKATGTYWQKYCTVVPYVFMVQITCQKLIIHVFPTAVNIFSFLCFLQPPPSFSAIRISYILVSFCHPLKIENYKTNCHYYFVWMHNLIPNFQKNWRLKQFEKTVWKEKLATSTAIKWESIWFVLFM